MNNKVIMPKKIPALEVVPTGETVTYRGVTYNILKIERAKKYV